jgi:glycosyltransferase involved in cell wall biosynthesis
MINKKIILFWPYYPPDPGAAASRGYSLLKFLKNEGFLVSIITKNNGKYKKYNDDENVFRLKNKPSFVPWKIALDIKTILNSIPEKSGSNVIASYPDVLWSFYAFIVAKKISANFFLDMRDLPLSSSNKIKVLLNKLILKKLTNKARKIFVTTLEQGEMLNKNFKTNKEKIVLVPNGIDLKDYPIKKVNPRKKYDIVFLGSINPERNLPGLEKLFRKLFEVNPKIKILFVGIDKQNKFALGLLNNIYIHIKNDNIKIIEEIPNKDAFLKTSRAKIGVVSISDDPSTKYQMPVKIFEYMAGGLVLAGLIPKKNRVINNFIEKNNCGIKDSDPKKLALKINILLKNTKELNKISKKNLLEIEKFDRKNFFKSIIKYM